MDYEEGVQMYAASKFHNTRNLSQLRKGSSNRNLSLLIRLLRNLPEPNEAISHTIIKKINKAPLQVDKSEPPKRFEAQKKKSAHNFFKRVQYGELPPILKIRFRELSGLFYTKCDLKFELNDLSAVKETEALHLQIKIEDIDQQMQTIWKEIDHWNAHKTYLPSEVTEDFSKLTPLELYKKARSLESSISKKQKRIKVWKQKLKTELNKQNLKKLDQQINNTSRGMHQDEVNLRKIQELL